MIQLPNKYRKHIGKLCSDFQVKKFENIPTSSGSIAEADIVDRTIIVPKLSTDRAYLAGMHELGHIALWDARSPSEKDIHNIWENILQEEAEAWKWAFDHSMIDINLPLWKDCMRCLHTYHLKRWSAIKLPKTDHFYWKWMKEYEGIIDWENSLSYRCNPLEKGNSYVGVYDQGNV